MMSATGNTTYAIVEIIRALEDAGIRAYVPLTDWDKRSSLFGRDAFTYDAEADHYTCPTGAILHWDRHDYVRDPSLRDPSLLRGRRSLATVHQSSTRS
jgi:hypothetical protein